MLARVTRPTLRLVLPSLVTAPLVAVAVAVAVAACDSGSAPGFAGVACSTTSDCSSGLQCLDYEAPGEGGCASYGLTCVQPCKTNADCAGSGFACYAVCGTAAICQPPMDAGEQ